jgi:AmiR/NasT family two-component response regulator
LIHVNGLKAAPPLRADLEAAGIQVLGIATERAKLLQEVVRQAPDVVICDRRTPEIHSMLQAAGIGWLNMLASS